MSARIIAVVAGLVIGSSAIAQGPQYKDAKAPVSERVADLLRRMTLDEKLQQVRSLIDANAALDTVKKNGLGFYAIGGGHSLPLKDLVALLNRIQREAMSTRLGIPVIPYDEALHGLLDRDHASFPQAIGLAATFDPELVHEVATAIAEETRAMGIRQVLSPVVNVVRDARWGRVEETYGEDPYLESLMAVAFVSGFEANGVVTTPKHFIANFWDGGRDSNSVHISERQLLDVYAPPFEAAFRLGHSRSTMVSYNALNGIPAAASPWLLNDFLRTKLGFEGYVVSDWGASDHVYDQFHYAKDAEEAAALEIKAGMDAEHPGTDVYGDPLKKAIIDGLASEKDLDRSVARILKVKFELGLFENPYSDADAAARIANSAGHRELAYRAVIESAVLLKNDRATLPLSARVKNVLVLGDVANGPTPLGGYSGEPGPRPSFLEGLVRERPDIRFSFVGGVGLVDRSRLPAIPEGALKTPDGKPGLLGEYFRGETLSGAPVFTRVDPHLMFDWTANGPGGGLEPTEYSVRWKGTLTVDSTGDYWIGASADDGVRVSIAGGRVIDDWSVHAERTTTGMVHLVAGVAMPITVEYFQAAGQATLSLGLQRADGGNELTKRIEADAERADATIVFARIVEGEGADHAKLDLPGNQEEAILAANRAGKPVVVVIVAGSAVTGQSWLPSASAVLDVWYPGEEGSRAVAALLCGKANPGGKLPLTFPIYVGQEPLYYNAEQTGRGFDYADTPYSPQFPFGFGLSYTEFKYTKLAMTKNSTSAELPYTLTVEVQNTGKVAGDEVVQLYLHQEVSKPLRAMRQMIGCRRISLAPGASKTVSFPVGFDQLCMFDEKLTRVVQPGKFHLMVGSSSSGIRLETDVEVSTLLKK